MNSSSRAQRGTYSKAIRSRGGSLVRLRSLWMRNPIHYHIPSRPTAVPPYRPIFPLLPDARPRPVQTPKGAGPEPRAPAPEQSDRIPRRHSPASPSHRPIWRGQASTPSARWPWSGGEGASGHPGTPMGLAPLAYLLWTRFIRHNPGTRTGRTATASSSPAATPRCCSTRCSTSPGTVCRSRRSSASANGASKTPGHPEHGPHPRRRGRPPVRSARGSATRSAWPSPSASAPSATTARARARRPPDLGHASDGEMMEGVRHEAAPSPATSSSASSRSSTTTTTSHRRPHRTQLLRGRGPAVRGLRLARGEGGRRQRPRGDCSGVPGGPGGDGAPTLVVLRTAIATLPPPNGTPPMPTAPRSGQMSSAYQGSHGVAAGAGLLHPR